MFHIILALFADSELMHIEHIECTIQWHEFKCPNFVVDIHDQTLRKVKKNWVKIYLPLLL